MAHKYELFVEKEGCPKIEIGNKHDQNIRYVKIKLDTLHDDTLDKSGAMLAKIEVSGDINDPVNESLLQLFDWAKDFNKKTTYRKVTINVIEEEHPFRTYEFEEVFVVDYTEEYNSEAAGDKGGSFTLSMSQKENELKKAKTFPGAA